MQGYFSVLFWFDMLFFHVVVVQSLLILYNENYFNWESVGVLNLSFDKYAPPRNLKVYSDPYQYSYVSCMNFSRKSDPFICQLALFRAQV